MFANPKPTMRASHDPRLQLKPKQKLAADSGMCDASSPKPDSLQMRGTSAPSRARINSNLEKCAGADVDSPKWRFLGSAREMP